MVRPCQFKLSQVPSLPKNLRIQCLEIGSCIHEVDTTCWEASKDNLLEEMGSTFAPIVNSDELEQMSRC
jgi:hypothetical protein